MREPKAYRVAADYARGSIEQPPGWYLRRKQARKGAPAVRYARALSVASAGTASHARELRSPRLNRPALIALLLAVVSVLLIVGEVVSGWHVLHATGLFTALAAKKYVWANAAVALGVTAIAVFAPGRARWLAVLAPGVFLAGVILATAVGGGAAGAILMALLTMGALWDTGERLLRLVGAAQLARNALVAWLAGIGPWGLTITLLGRLYAVKWWTVGAIVIVVGTVGLFRLGRAILGRREEILREIGDSPLTLASTGLILLTAGWAAIYSAAPELQYDALYGKAALPEAWARSGHIGSIARHVQFEITGWFQVIATPGHLFGATAIGRYLQLVGLLCAAAAIWWWGRRHGALGPLAALAVAVTPHLIWQSSTADDDLLLALCALAMCVAIVETMRRSDTGSGSAFALGLMAGSAPSLKLHLVPLFAFLTLGWLFATRALPALPRRISAAVGGAAITGLPPLILRWIDSGNPILPAYNNIFRSSYWLPINEQANFPFWMHPGSFGFVKAVWDAVVDPDKMAEASPPGAFGLLIGAIVAAVLLGWLGRERSRADRVVWFALIPALIFWWISLRYLRYLLPVGFVSVALLLMLTSAIRLGRRTRAAAVASAAVLVAAAFPVTISQFFNVPSHKPPVYAAIGKWSASSYESDALPERTALLAFNRLAPAHANVATSAYERSWLTGSRDLYNLHYEPAPLMELHGPLPRTGDEALRALKRIGIGWLLLTEADRLQGQTGWLSQVITTHGQDEFSARGWDLYRLTAKPRVPRPVSSCDRVEDGVPSCWLGSRTAGDGLRVSATRLVRTCPGQTIVLSVTQDSAPTSVPVLIRFNADPATGTQPGFAAPGTTQRIYATAPINASVAEVIIGTAPGATITRATIGRLGRECPAA